MKETIIIVIVIAIVTICGIVTQNYLKQTSSQILEKLSQLKEEVQKAQENNQTQEAQKISEEIIKEWEEINKNWSMLVIHEELDNIEMALIELKSCIETVELEDGIKEIDKATFLLGHIQDKESFKIKNIF